MRITEQVQARRASTLKFLRSGGLNPPRPAQIRRAMDTQVIQAVPSRAILELDLIADLRLPVVVPGQA